MAACLHRQRVAIGQLSGLATVAQRSVLIALEHERDVQDAGHDGDAGGEGHPSETVGAPRSGSDRCCEAMSVHVADHAWYRHANHDVCEPTNTSRPARAERDESERHGVAIPHLARHTRTGPAVGLGACLHVEAQGRHWILAACEYTEPPAHGPGGELVRDEDAVGPAGRRLP
jgi:hypothetical protein